MTEWQIGFTSGVAATLVGFILSMVWDSHKYNRDIKRRDKTIIHAISHELEENRKLAVENIKTIDQELELLTNGKYLIQPLQLLKISFWDLLKVNLPNTYLKDSKLLVQIRDASTLSIHINEAIRCRQLFKTTGLALDGFDATVKKHDSLIKSDFIRLNELLDNVLSITEAI